MLHHTGLKECWDWSTIYRFFHYEEFPFYHSEDSSNDSKAMDQKEDRDTYVNIHCSRIYHIACRPAILPFYDMVRWIIGKIDLHMRIIVNTSGLMIGSLRPDGIAKLYKTK